MENVMEFLGKQSKKESYLDRDTFPSESRWWRIFNERKLVLELLNVVKAIMKKLGQAQHKLGMNCN